MVQITVRTCSWFAEKLCGQKMDHGRKFQDGFNKLGKVLLVKHWICYIGFLAPSQIPDCIVCLPRIRRCQCCHPGCIWLASRKSRMTPTAPSWAPKTSEYGVRWCQQRHPRFPSGQTCAQLVSSSVRYNMGLGLFGWLLAARSMDERGTFQGLFVDGRGFGLLFGPISSLRRVVDGGWLRTEHDHEWGVHRARQGVGLEGDLYLGRSRICWEESE